MHLYDLFRWLMFVLLGGVGWWLIILNFAIVYRWYARGEHHSFVPLVGGFVALIGMGVCPLQPVRRFAWAPLFVDCAYSICVLTLGLGGMVLKRFFRGQKNDA